MPSASPEPSRIARSRRCGWHSFPKAGRPPALALERSVSAQQLTLRVLRARTRCGVHAHRPRAARAAPRGRACRDQRACVHRVRCLALCCADPRRSSVETSAPTFHRVLCLAPCRALLAPAGLSTPVLVGVERRGGWGGHTAGVVRDAVGTDRLPQLPRAELRSDGGVTAVLGATARARRTGRGARIPGDTQQLSRAPPDSLIGQAPRRL